MTKSHWGIKRVCNSGSCTARFYDFNLAPITCPKCGASYSQKLSASSFYDERHSDSTAEPALEVEEENNETDTESSDTESVEAISLDDARDEAV